MLKIIPTLKLLHWRLPRFLEERVNAQIGLRQNPLLTGLLSGLLLGLWSAVSDVCTASRHR